MKKILHLSLLFACSVAPGLAWAAGTTAAGAGNPVTFRLSGFNPPSFDPGISIGSVIYSATILMGNGGKFTCYPEVGNIYARGTSGVRGDYSTYPTGVSGVGIRFRTTAPPWPATVWWPIGPDYHPGPNAYFNTKASIEVQLVKVGDIPSGGRLSGEVGGMFAQNGVSKIGSVVMNGIVEIKPMVSTCKVIPPAPVPLGNISVGKFTGVGVGTTAIPFKIRLSCSGGAASARKNIFVTLSDPTAPFNRSDVLSLISGSTATGIGIQVVYKDSYIIKYGADSSTPGNYNQWFAGSAGNGEFEIPLTARYIQVAARVTPGSANGRATFTMSYQ